ncbi:MAG TPA: ATP-binding protein, partial [Paludibacter sp.]|nr:ATP-binding protein [Paludibacter sp.]
LTKNDLLLIGGINGLNATNLKKPWIFQHLQKPLFTSLSLFGTTVKPGEHYNGNEILGHSISSTDKIELRYNQNFISIGFSALNYVNPSQTYYRYRLEGLDNDWREISAANGDGSATYTNLAPGTYELQVEAANNSKEWSANVAHLTIIVHPPFWKTPLAYLLYLVLVCSAILLIYKNMQQRARNLTARRNAEKLNHMKFAFFTNISHEFRTPLTLILTPLESLLKEIKGTEIGNRLRPVYRNAQELLNLVNQLLDFRRLEIHGEKLNLSFGNISAFASQFEEIFSRLAFERKISFHVNCSPDELLVFFDNSKLYKVINNLLSNAFKFTPDGGEITLDLKRVEDNIVIRVIDNGQGIPENEIAHVFDRFYQASGVEGGSGIGLHLVKEYVELHNGTIEAESLPGIKTVFTVRLPMDLSPETSNGVEAYEPVIEPGEHAFPNNCSYKLLVVEDNEELRHFLVSELYKSYQLIEAKDGVEGLEKAIAEQPDLIISDVMMPRMDGVELCRKIKSELATSHIPVILLTARASEEQRMTGYEAGADEYLAKPFNMDILLMRIAKLIDNQRIRQKRFTEKVEINPSEITITSLDEQLVQKALALIECNMGNGDYSVQQLSQDLAMDRTVLYKKLQSITGLAPLEFIRSIRIKRAAALLTQGKYPVAEVAEMVGFNTQKYFSRYFKEAFGATPSQYVQQFNENAVNNKPYQK